MQIKKLYKNVTEAIVEKSQVKHLHLQQILHNKSLKFTAGYILDIEYSLIFNVS